MIFLERLFLLGLDAFLFAHIFYISGFWEQMINITVWSLILVVFIVSNTGGLLRRLVAAMRSKGENKLVIPVILYGAIISVMLYAAMTTIYDPAWKTSAALFVSAGAFLFCASDLILAWNRFVSPHKNGRVWSIALYHLGQIGLVAGVVSQFG
jgi:alkenylglycerophosphocholine/alkenylglycerophosphoethanolamine hydrolase